MGQTRCHKGGASEQFQVCEFARNLGSELHSYIDIKLRRRQVKPREKVYAGLPGTLVCEESRVRYKDEDARRKY